MGTIGPASARPDVLEGMVAAGLDAVRLNFFHGTQESHALACRMVREASAHAGRPIAVLQDLQCPKIRIGKVRGGGMEVPTGSRLVVTTRSVEGANGVVSTEYEALTRDVSPGMAILFDEGRLKTVVREVRGQDVICDVLDGGVLSSHKGISVPGAALTAEAMSDKDRADVRFGLALGVDLVALSFVRRAGDVEDLRALMRAEGRVLPIIAKIETPQAIDHLDEILDAAEGVMVARGDLGIELALEMIPVHQKHTIERANHAGKLVITATQMLESMTENIFPTRAEVTDVANAVLDGTDAIMLSGETAIGKHPVEVVRRMSVIAKTAEEKLYPFERRVRSTNIAPADFAAVVARLAAQGAHDVEAKAIVTFTKSGRTAMVLSDERPRQPVLALTTEPATQAWLALYWGIVSRHIPAMGSLSELVALAELLLREAGLAHSGDVVVYVLGDETSPDAANAVKVARVGLTDNPFARQWR
jgi:pyruvate kinase